MVDNALDHARAEVVIDVQEGRGSCRIEVTDDGPGIDAAVLPRLFERFATARGAGSARRHYGIGLALVADVAAAHVGQVGVGTAAGGSGAVLTLTLPSARPTRL